MIISPNGDILAQLYEEEGVLDFEINLEDMLSLRKSFPVLNDRAQNYDISEVE
jgi:predicted amidohydrolase